MTKHKWKKGWKEIRGFYVDTCEKCGVGHGIGATTMYIPSEQVQTFLTTTKSVDFFEFLPCQRV